MKRVLAIIFLCISHLSAIQTDVYFANGILTSEKQAKQNAKLLRKKPKHPDIKDIKVAYNHTFDSYFVKGFIK